MEWGFVGRQDELRQLLDAVADGRSILLSGPAGVGKSRLAAEVASSFARTHHIERLIGSPSIRQLPFGGVAHLVGHAPLPDPSILITFLARSLQKRAGDKRIAVFIDDIDQLDDGSIGLIQHLVLEDFAVVLATAREDGARDPRILPLWKDGLLERMDIAPLSRDETEELTSRILGHPPATDLQNQVWRLTEGHPLFVREVLLEAIDQGTAAEHGGIVTLTQPLGSSRRVADMVQLRTAHLDDNELGGLRMIALCQPVSLPLARRVVPEAVLASLESKQMLNVDQTASGPRVRTTHPLVAEVTIDQMPTIARAAMTAKLAEVLIASPTMTPRDAMRASLWLLEAGESPPQNVAIQGARSALEVFDAELARRLAESALATGVNQEAKVLLGRALTAAGEGAAAISTLREAQNESQTDAELAAATVTLAELYMFNLGEAANAVAALERALETTREPGSRAEMISHLMLAAGIIGDFELGLGVGSEVVDRMDLPETAQLRSVMAITLIQTMTGKLDRIIERLDRGEALAARHSELQPFAPDQMGLNRILALHALGSLTEADQFAGDSIRRGVGLPGPWLFNRTMTRPLTGDIHDAVSLSRQALDQLEQIDPLGLRPMAGATHALLLAMAGHVQPSQQLLKQVMSDPRGALPRARVWAGRAEAWIASHDGQFEKAADLAVRTGREATDATHYVWGAMATHDAVRFGFPGRALDDLLALQAEQRGPLVSLLADHASALAGTDIAELHEVADRSTEAGARAMAAECWARMATLTSGSERARHTHVAFRMLGACPGFTSVWFRELEPPLSERQDEIARLAAAGSTSKEIASELHLSARTVDNHLRKVYLALGIDGRHELSALYRV